MFEALTRFIDSHEKFVVTTHVNPDCDALGSALGMAYLIEARGKQARIINTDPTPSRFSFVDPDSRIEVYSETVFPAEDEAVVVVDVGDLRRIGKLGEFLLNHPRPFACVDHHKSNTGFAQVNILQPEACATGLILARLAKEWGIPFNQTLANALYIAMYTDTGGFRFPNTDAETLRVASELVEAGAEASYLATEFHENMPIGRVRLFGEVLENFRTEADGKIIYVTISLDQLEKHGCDRSDVEGFVEYIRGIEGVELAILFRQADQENT
ncbi:MAG: bifunctional oligoribonuclease/PAP phosphatase NrnA, partial [Candidatus Omnitrophica bacterium]|nr:bifunctional oligoribonuclease/PAP phosphatase NrnA [Candidatus Omnitrophota bacterium]